MDDNTKALVAAQLTVAWATREGADATPPSNRNHPRYIPPERQVIAMYEKFVGQVGDLHPDPDGDDIGKLIGN